MAKNKKSTKKVQNRFSGLGAMLVMLVPAILAALTAFMNTAFARENGLSWEDAGLGDTRSKSSKRSRKA